MKRWTETLVVGLVIVFFLAACGKGAESEVAANSGSESGESGAAADEQMETVVPQIRDDFDNALSPMGQLALGTMRLDEGQLAVDETQAAELLPLWQALQSLSNDQTTAQVELDAVVKQIQGTMSAEQVAAIAAMQLTEDSLTELIESGELGLRGFGGRNVSDDGEGGLPFPPGGFGGGPGGGFGPPGGGPGGGLGGPGGGFGANLSEDDIATRRAEFAESGLGDLSERFLAGAVVRLLQTKSGQAPAGGGSLFETVFAAVEEETGMTIEAIQAAMAEGQTLAQIIESNGGDVEAVRQVMIGAFEALPDAGEFDAEERADQWLYQEQGQ